MGYYTDFDGGIKIKPSLTKEHKAYLYAFMTTRRMARDEDEVAKLPDPLREAVGLPIGIDGEFYVGGVEDAEKGRYENDGNYHHSITDHNQSPGGCPSLWCHYAIEEDHLHAVDGKNYAFIEWLFYLNEQFFQPWGYQLSGNIDWDGEDEDDRGELHVRHNEAEGVNEFDTVVMEVRWPKPFTEGVWAKPEPKPVVETVMSLDWDDLDQLFSTGKTP